LSTCSAIEKRRLMVTPSALIDSLEAFNCRWRHRQGTSAPPRHEDDIHRLGSFQLQIVDISPQLDIYLFCCTRLYIGWRYNEICIICIFMHGIVYTARSVKATANNSSAATHIINRRLFKVLDTLRPTVTGLDNILQSNISEGE
jgi:hypothetical protein